MQVRQNLSILFYRKTKKRDSEGNIPIYCRVTIDGVEDEISTSCKVKHEDWDSNNKQVLPTHPKHKVINKKIGQMRTDLERHFDLAVAKHGLATPKKVFASYQTPVNGHVQKLEKLENTALGLDIDKLVQEYIKYDYQLEKARNEKLLQEPRLERLRSEKTRLDEALEKLAKRGQEIFDNKERLKTLLLATDEFILNFLQLTAAGARAANTLKKKWGTKRRLQEYMLQRYKMDDIPLASLEYRFIEDFTKNEIIIHGSGHNTIWKYVQIINEIMDRAVATGWMLNNIFAIYDWDYEEPRDKEWPRMKDMLHLISFKFEPRHKELSDIRDIFVYQSFAGPSYAELFALKDCHLFTVDGKTWVDQNRRKSTSKESLPLLPICLEIIEKFRNHPRCLRTGKLLPVPTGQHYNRSLKVIGDLTGITCLNNSHQARYFFANEVSFASNKDLQMTGLLMGQRNPNSVKTYVKPAREQIAETMQTVEEKLYGAGGPFLKEQDTELINLLT